MGAGLGSQHQSHGPGRCRVGHQANGGPRQPRPNSVAAQCGAGMFFQFGVSAPRVLMETWSLTELFGFLQPNIFQA